MVDAEHAEVRDRGRAALIFVRRKAAAARAPGQPFHFVRNLCERLPFHALDYRCEKAALNGDCNADVRAFVKQDAALGEGGVGFGHKLEREPHRLDEEIVHGQLVGVRPFLRASAR